MHLCTLSPSAVTFTAVLLWRHSHIQPGISSVTLHHATQSSTAAQPTEAAPRVNVCSSSYFLWRWIRTQICPFSPARSPQVLSPLQAVWALTALVWFTMGCYYLILNTGHKSKHLSRVEIWRFEAEAGLHLLFTMHKWHFQRVCWQRYWPRIVTHSRFHREPSPCGRARRAMSQSWEQGAE